MGRECLASHHARQGRVLGAAGEAAERAAAARFAAQILLVGRRFLWSGSFGFAKSRNDELRFDLCLDKIVDRAATVCLWHNVQEKLEHVFGRHAIPMVWDYAEGNPLAGNWDVPWAISWAIKVVQANSCLQRPSHCYQGSATRLPFEDEQLSAVVSDPPYYDCVPYADISDFFYVWLRRAVGLNQWTKAAQDYGFLKPQHIRRGRAGRP